MALIQVASRVGKAAFPDIFSCSFVIFELSYVSVTGLIGLPVVLPKVPAASRLVTQP